MTATTDTFRDLLEANAPYARMFRLGHLEAKAARGLAIVTCFDSRIEPLAMLGLAPGDAKILRVAGGRVSDSVIESLQLATDRLGVDRIAIVQHTDCAAPSTGPETIDADLRRVRAEVDVPADRVGGFVYDVRTGRLTPRAEGTSGAS
jgi:carbonic anhydrase